MARQWATVLHPLATVRRCYRWERALLRGRVFLPRKGLHRVKGRLLSARGWSVQVLRLKARHWYQKLGMAFHLLPVQASYRLWDHRWRVMGLCCPLDHRWRVMGSCRQWGHRWGFRR